MADTLELDGLDLNDGINYEYTDYEWDVPKKRIQTENLINTDGARVLPGTDFYGAIKHRIGIRVLGGASPTVDTTQDNLGVLLQKLDLRNILLKYQHESATNASYIEVLWSLGENMRHSHSELDQKRIEIDLVLTCQPYWKGAFRHTHKNMLPYYVASGGDKLRSAITDHVNVVGSAVITVFDGTGGGPDRRSLPNMWEIDPTAATGDGIEHDDTPASVPVVPGETYTFSTYACGATGSLGAIRAKLIAKDVTGANINSTIGSPATVTDDITETRLTATHLMPSNAAYAVWQVYTNDTTGYNFFLDDLQLELGSSATTYQSPVDRYDVGANLLESNRASAETDTTGWNVVGTDYSIARDITTSYHGAACIKVTKGSAGAGYTWVGTDIDDIDSTPGALYTGSVYIKHDGTSPGDDLAGCFAQIVATDGATEWNTDAGSTITMTDEWQRMDVTTGTDIWDTGTPDRLRLRAAVPSLPNTNFFVDAKMVEPGATLSPFRMPGPVEGQGTFEIEGDLPTPMRGWFEPEGDYLAKLLLGFRTQNDEGAPELTGFDNATPQPITPTSSYLNLFNSDNTDNLEMIRGRYRMIARIKTDAAASDYFARWRINLTVDNGTDYYGPDKKLTSTTSYQLVDLGPLSIPPATIPFGNLMQYFDNYRVQVQIKKTSGANKVTIDRLILLPIDNGICFTEGVTQDAARTVLAMDAIGSPPTMSYEKWCPGQTMLALWPTGLTSEVTAQIADMTPRMVGYPGTNDYAFYAGSDTGILAALNICWGYEPRYGAPVA